MRSKVAWLGAIGLCALAGQAICGAGTAPPPRAKAAARADTVALGREIFNREWLPGDARSHGGDGLGPVYNDSSCVACHNSGGVGGGGPVNKNIDILSASRNRGGMGGMMGGIPGGMGNFNGQAGSAPPPAPATNSDQPQQAGAKAAANTPPAPNTDVLFELHPGFRNGRTVVLHKFGSDPNYQAWRGTMLGRSGGPFQQAVAINTTVSQFDTATAPFQATSAVTEQAGAVVQTPATGPFDFARAPSAAGDSAGQAVAREVQLTQVAAFGAPGAFRSGPVPDMDGRAARGAALLQETRNAMLNALANGARTQIFAGEFVVTRSQRNATSLFGIGLIDRIPESAIVAAASRRSSKFPEIQGRVSRLKNGRIGRLGWKGQTASVEDFVLTACAVELGLEVPGHEQAMSPQAPKYRAAGKDLTADECASLVAYVRSIPKPLERMATAPAEASAIADGKAQFTSIGCAECHSPSLGGVEGIYSDLLLHDMGQELADSGSYNGGSDDDGEPLNPILEGGQAAPVNANAKGAAQPRADRPATRGEWRTPPLWGFRDSGPYLHDGRAETLEQAVSGHGGQGAASAQRFFELTPKERLQVETFLKSLVAPQAGSGNEPVAG
jgi:CxxC motif-containing protein (DUF1111 family)